MAGLWPLRPRSLHAGLCAGERVMGVNQNISGLERGDRVVVNTSKVLTSKVLTCRFPDFRSRKRVSDPKPISDVASCTYNHILKPSIPTLALSPQPCLTLKIASHAANPQQASPDSDKMRLIQRRPSRDSHDLHNRDRDWTIQCLVKVLYENKLGPDCRNFD